MIKIKPDMSPRKAWVASHMSVEGTRRDKSLAQYMEALRASPL